MSISHSIFQKPNDIDLQFGVIKDQGDKTLPSESSKICSVCWPSQVHLSLTQSLVIMGHDY